MVHGDFRAAAYELNMGKELVRVKSPMDQFTHPGMEPGKVIIVQVAASFKLQKDLLILSNLFCHCEQRTRNLGPFAG